jgi:tRNA (cytidine/uridine-2'-O-)-methyltransferase
VQIPTLPILMPDQPFNIVLVEPEIPPNTGSIARLCGATGSVLHLVHPLGFSVDDKHLRRAGLDYWPFVEVRHWPGLDEFLESCREDILYLFTTKTERPYFEARFAPGSYLVFGRETRGLPEEIIALYRDRCYTIPMENTNIRSLNLAMCAGIVLYEAIRQFRPGSGPGT